MSGSASSRAPERRLLAREVEKLVGSAREARWIVEEVGGDEVRATALALRRMAGEPLQHVLGHWGFRRLDVVTDGRALVPRPETETVVDLALAHLRRLRVAGALWIADLGTGSGAIACALADELDPRLDVHILAAEASADALALARENVERTKTGGRVELVKGDWFEALPPEAGGRLDLIVSNPPYLAEAELAMLDAVVRDHDPHRALIAGPSGLECLEHLITGAPEWLARGGALVLEIAPHQREAVMDLAARTGFRMARVHDDLAGRPRVLVAER